VNSQVLVQERRLVHVVLEIFARRQNVDQRVGQIRRVFDTLVSGGS